MGKPSIEWRGTPNCTSGNDGRLFLFPHICEGYYEGSISTLKDPNRQASAQYVIEGSKAAQLVSEDDTSWHCGNWWYNRRSISYEMVGTTANPPSRDTLDTTAYMMAQASKKYFNGAKLVRGTNVMLHREVSSTTCPATSDIDWLMKRANEYIGGAAASTPENAPVASGDIEDLALRTIRGEFGSGQDRINALGSKYQAVQNRVNEILGVKVPQSSAAIEPAGASDFGGTYRCTVDGLRVRTSPGISTTNIVKDAEYNVGDTVNLDNWYVIKDGWVWGRYTGATSGEKRYVAVGKATGKPESDDYLIKIG